MASHPNDFGPNLIKKFWSAPSLLCTALLPLARVVFSAHGSFTAGEAAFSATGAVQPPFSSRLREDRIDKLAVIRLNTCPAEFDSFLTGFQDLMNDSSGRSRAVLAGLA